MAETISLCSRCGSGTVWDVSFGAVPFCPDCWDKKVDAEKAPMEALQKKSGLSGRGLNAVEYQQAYYLVNKALLVRNKQAYYETHREAYFKRHSLYYETHRDELLEYNRKRRLFTDFGTCVVCGLPIHFNRSDGWRHYRKDRPNHFAEKKMAVNDD